MSKDIIFTEKAPAAIGPYSQGNKSRRFNFHIRTVAVKS